MPLHLHYADPPPPRPQRRATGIASAALTTAASIAIIGAAYWLLFR